MAVRFQALPYSAGTRAMLNNPKMVGFMRRRGNEAARIFQATTKRDPNRASGVHNADSVEVHERRFVGRRKDRAGVDISAMKEYSMVRENKEHTLMRAIGKASGGMIASRVRRANKRVLKGGW